MPKYNLSDKQLNDITNAILARQKIQAIKLFVDATGYGLKEAKEEVEVLMAALAEEHPQILEKKSSPLGCVLVLFIIAAIFLAFIFYVSAADSGNTKL